MMQDTNIKTLTSLLRNYFSLPCYEKRFPFVLSAGLALFLLSFFVTVTKCTVFESENVFLTHTGSLPGWHNKSNEQKPFKVSEFSFQCFILKPQTAALLHPGYMYSPSASALNILTWCMGLDPLIFSIFDCFSCWVECSAKPLIETLFEWMSHIAT